MSQVDSLLKLKSQHMDAADLERQISLLRKVAAARDKFLNVQLQTQIGQVGRRASARAPRWSLRRCVSRLASLSVSCSASAS